MTATERVVRGSHDDVFSMSDETTYGGRFYQLTFKSAIEQSIISDYRVLTVTVTDSSIRGLVSENRLIKVGVGEVDAPALAAAIALRRAFKRYGLTHAISFHRSIKAAREFADRQARLDYLIRPRLVALHISSKNSAGERADLMRSFVSQSRALMTNARCLNEGVDVPAIDCVLFAEPKQSVVDIVQATGRALRPSPGKQYGYVLLPVVVPDGVDIETFAETTAFRQIARTVTALSTQDERIAEYFRVIDRGRNRSGDIVEIQGDIPVGLKIGLGEFARQINTKLWERVGRANWRPFSDARDYARSLGLQNLSEWRAKFDRRELPPDIPGWPDGAYREGGWISWGDWLGTSRIATTRRLFLNFHDAREFARGKHLGSTRAWNEFCKGGDLPIDVPRNPHVVYRNSGWISYGDWLGTGFVASTKKRFWSFARARSFVRALGLKHVAEWSRYVDSGQLPPHIPASPAHSYRGKGWKGFPDWLGSEFVAASKRVYRPFPQAREFARALRVRSNREWQAMAKRGELPKDIPADPRTVYANNGWNGWKDWLGNSMRPFAEARAFARALKLKSGDEWKAFTKTKKCPPGLPAAPDYAYPEWAGWADWLGHGRRRGGWRPFEQARHYVRTLGLQSEDEWRRFCKSGKKPEDIPASPAHVYRGNGWRSMGDWLGTGYVAVSRREYLPFARARARVRKLGLRNVDDWRRFCRSGNRPSDIPANPYGYYAKSGWVSWNDWLGIGSSGRKR